MKKLLLLLSTITILLSNPTLNDKERCTNDLENLSDSLKKVFAYINSKNINEAKAEAHQWQIKLIDFRIECKEVDEYMTSIGHPPAIVKFNEIEQSLVDNGYLKGSSVIK